MGRRIDMGTSFPLSSTRYPMREHALWPFMFFLALFVIPVFYLLDPKGDGITIVIALCMLFGIWSGYVFCRCLRTRVRYVVDRENVTVDARIIRKVVAEKIPLSEYKGIVETIWLGRSFWGMKPVHVILLWHPTDSRKYVELYGTTRKAKHQERLALLEQLFNLPLNPAEAHVMGLQKHHYVDFFREVNGQAEANH